MNKHCRDGTWWYINTITWNHGYISRWWRIHDKQFCVHNQNWRLLNREDWKFAEQLGRKIWNTDPWDEDFSRTKRQTLASYRYHLIIIYIEQNCEEITMNHVSGLPRAFRKEKDVIWITAKSIVTSTYYFCSCNKEIPFYVRNGRCNMTYSFYCVRPRLLIYVVKEGGSKEPEY